MRIVRKYQTKKRSAAATLGNKSGDLLPKGEWGEDLVGERGGDAVEEATWCECRIRDVAAFAGLTLM